MWHLDEPFFFCGLVGGAFIYVARAARERVTVALSRETERMNCSRATSGGARFNLLESRVRQGIPRWLRRGVLGPVSGIWPKENHLPRALRWKFFLRNVGRIRTDAYLHDMSLFTPGDKRSLLSDGFQRSLNGYTPFAGFRRHFEQVRGLDHLSQILYVDFKTYLANDSW